MASSSSSSSSSSSLSSPPRPSHDNWVLFLRQRRIQDQLKRLRNDFKHCHCPPGCRGQQQDHVVVNPRDVPGLPAQPLHGPHVRVDSDLPDTWARPDSLRAPGSTVLAEARGTSDIRMHRTGARATLRMSMQVRSDATQAGRTGYFGEMFLTQHGQPEEFIGFIQAWYMDRRRRPDQEHTWEDIYLDDYGEEFTRWRDRRNDMASHRDYFIRLFGEYFGIWENADRDENGNLLPDYQFRDHFGSAWARANEDTDIVYIPFIWIDQRFTGQRIIDQGFELFWRLMTGGSLPEPYNVTRPLSAFLEAGILGPPWASNWQGSDGQEMDYFQQLRAIASAYERNGFMLLINSRGPAFWYMGRRVDPADFTAAPGDMAIVPPNPPATNLQTPSPVRRRRRDALRRRDDDPGDVGDPGDDADDDSSSPLPAGRPPGGPTRGAPGTGMGIGKGPPPRTPLGNRRGQPTTPSTPGGGRPTTGGLSLGSAQRRLF